MKKLALVFVLAAFSSLVASAQESKPRFVEDMIWIAQGESGEGFVIHKILEENGVLSFDVTGDTSGSALITIRFKNSKTAHAIAAAFQWSNEMGLLIKSDNKVFLYDQDEVQFADPDGVLTRAHHDQNGTVSISDFMKSVGVADEASRR